MISWWQSAWKCVSRALSVITQRGFQRVNHSRPFAILFWEYACASQQIHFISCFIMFQGMHHSPSIHMPVKKSWILGHKDLLREFILSFQFCNIRVIILLYFNKFWFWNFKVDLKIQLIYVYIVVVCRKHLKLSFRKYIWSCYKIVVFPLWFRAIKRRQLFSLMANSSNEMKDCHWFIPGFTPPF